MHKLIEYLCDELLELEDKVANGGKLSLKELEYGDVVAHFKKDLLTSKAMEEGYSRDGSYENGSSGARRRDSMGRYMDGGSYNYRDGDSGRSYDEGYSGRRYSRDEGKSHMIQQFESMMGEASREEREVIQSALEKLKRM